MSEIGHCISSFVEQVTLSDFSLLQSCWNFAPRHLENYSKNDCILFTQLIDYAFLCRFKEEKMFSLHSLKLLNNHEKCLNGSLKTNLHLCKVRHSFFFFYSQSISIALKKQQRCVKIQRQLSETITGDCQ